MVNYRRNLIEGGSYFFTVALCDRRSSLLTDHINLLRTSFKEALAINPVTINAIVILPDHLHAIFTMPSGDAGYAARWRSIKAKFTRHLKMQGYPLPKNHRDEYSVWQRRFWEHTIRDETDFSRHVDYIHYNPVKHGLVNSVQDWPYSSFHRYVRQGGLPSNWGGEYTEPSGKYGE